MIEIKRNSQKDAQMPAEHIKTPLNVIAGQGAGKCAQGNQPALKRKIEAFTGMDARRDYRAMYRAAFAYHESHNPPTVDSEYWRTHIPGTDPPPQVEVDYWMRTAQDMSNASRQYGDDSFFIGLLIAISEELEHEYKARQQAARKCS